MVYDGWDVFRYVSMLISDLFSVEIVSCEGTKLKQKTRAH